MNIIKILLIFVILFIIYKIYRFIKKTVFRSNDYCTFFPEGKWGECCYKHDEACILATENLSYLMRFIADNELYKCVLNKGYPKIARLMYFGVRFWANTFWWFGYLKEKYYG